MAEEWVKSPELKVPVNWHGKGKSVVTGVVRIVFNGARTVYVTTDAHHNDSLPCLTFRGREWLASGHFTREEDGTWRLTSPDDRGVVSERGVWDWRKGTAPTFRDAITAALLATVAEYWTPELARQARYANAIQALPGARRELQEARQALQSAEEAVAALESEAAASAPVEA